MAIQGLLFLKMMLSQGGFNALGRLAKDNHAFSDTLLLAASHDFEPDQNHLAAQYTRYNTFIIQYS